MVGKAQNTKMQLSIHFVHSLQGTGELPMQHVPGTVSTQPVREWLQDMIRAIGITMSRNSSMHINMHEPCKQGTCIHHMQDLARPVSRQAAAP